MGRYNTCRKFKEIFKIKNLGHPRFFYGERGYKMKKVIHYCKKDAVLSISFLLCLFSAFIVPPSKSYIEYIDFHTLILLFCLMLIVEGLREQYFFSYVADIILKRIHSTKGLVFSLVGLCFFSSMLITNDVALITFVPFGMMLLSAAGMQTKIPFTVVLMSIAANLGSMFTPIGNPQNLYLFSLSGMKITSFFALMFPYTAASFILLAVAVVIFYKNKEIKVTQQEEKKLEYKKISIYVLLFILCLFCVSSLLSDYILLLFVVIGILLMDTSLFKKVDYSLLFTFLFFFIFIGNINTLEELHHMLSQWVLHHEKMFAILCSQIISNVPAAMLLSSYTEDYAQLIIGTNLGGLGTLIASMASLISYKQIAVQYPQQKKYYFVIFTLANLIFLCILWGLSILL